MRIPGGLFQLLVLAAVTAIAQACGGKKCEKEGGLCRPEDPDDEKLNPEGDDRFHNPIDEPRPAFPGAEAGAEFPPLDAEPYRVPSAERPTDVFSEPVIDAHKKWFNPERAFQLLICGEGIPLGQGTGSGCFALAPSRTTLCLPGQACDEDGSLLEAYRQDPSKLPFRGLLFWTDQGMYPGNALDPNYMARTGGAPIRDLSHYVDPDGEGPEAGQLIPWASDGLEKRTERTEEINLACHAFEMAAAGLICDTPPFPEECSPYRENGLSFCSFVEGTEEPQVLCCDAPPPDPNDPEGLPPPSNCGDNPNTPDPNDLIFNESQKICPGTIEREVCFPKGLCNFGDVALVWPMTGFIINPEAGAEEQSLFLNIGSDLTPLPFYIPFPPADDFRNESLRIRPSSLEMTIRTANQEVVSCDNDEATPEGLCLADVQGHALSRLSMTLLQEQEEEAPQVP